MRDRVEEFVRNGGNVAFLTGNTAMRQVRLENDNRTMVCVKRASLDRDVSCDCVTMSVSLPPINRPQNLMIGVGFDHGGYIGTSPPGDFQVRFPDHWVFAGLPQPVTLPPGLADFECDAADFVEEEEGYPRVTGEDGTPITFTILASADVRHWNGKPGRGTIGIFTRNGTVFNASTVVWASRLGDPAVSRITSNVIDRLRSRPGGPVWQDIGEARGVVALTALAGRLFAVTSDNMLRARFPIAANVPWREMGDAPDIRRLAASGDRLYGVTGGNELMSRKIVGGENFWRSVGSGADGETRALACAGGYLYAIEGSGRLVGRPAEPVDMGWGEVGSSDWSLRLPRETAITAMTGCRDMLFATTGDGRLLRTDWEFIWEAFEWGRVMAAPPMRGLAELDFMLFGATRDERLVCLDLRGVRD